MEKIFGRARQKQSEEERTRHLGVILKNVTVKGQALGDAIQPTMWARAENGLLNPP
jgi:ATP-binding cassette subfamily G (WHITE) protein 2 (SNQ2)